MFVARETRLPRGASLLAGHLVGAALVRCLHWLLTRSRLFLPTHSLATGLSVCLAPLTRLLNYDVILNVELVVHVHDVYLDPLSFLLVPSLRHLRLSFPFHVCWDYSLHVEKLLLVCRG